jgi:cysteine protease ATG4
MANLDWRKPPYPVQTADYATYIQLISWFLDSPSPMCPFSVHRMALAGKDLGKEVGQWFGPSTAAGAIKCVIISSPHLRPVPDPYLVI